MYSTYGTLVTWDVLGQCLITVLSAYDIEWEEKPAVNTTPTDGGSS